VGPAKRGGHEWHAAEYVRQWVADNEGRADERRQQFDRLADYIPHAAGAAISVLDLGAGWGPVTRCVLDRFPNARATLLDYSEQMFAVARTNLQSYGDRVRYVLADLSRPGGVAQAVVAAGGPFAAIVSASFSHNLHDDARLKELFRELRAALEPGGGFLNLDNMSTASPLLQSVWQRGRIEQHRRRRQAETGRLPSVEEAEAELQAERRRRFGIGGQPSAQPDTQPVAQRRGGTSRSVYEHLTWLREAGFDVAECFWRQDQRVLVGAYVEQP
jgi:trans-aconitate methyltransferase